MKRAEFSLLLAVIVSLSSTFSPSAGAQSRARETKTLISVIDPSTPGAAFKDQNGNYTGFEWAHYVEAIRRANRDSRSRYRYVIQASERAWKDIKVAMTDQSLLTAEKEGTVFVATGADRAGKDRDLYLLWQGALENFDHYLQASKSRAEELMKLQVAMLPDAVKNTGVHGPFPKDVVENRINGAPLKIACWDGIMCEELRRIYGERPQNIQIVPVGDSGPEAMLDDASADMFYAYAQSPSVLGADSKYTFLIYNGIKGIPNFDMADKVKPPGVTVAFTNTELGKAAQRDYLRQVVNMLLDGTIARLQYQFYGIVRWPPGINDDFYATMKYFIQTERNKYTEKFLEEIRRKRPNMALSITDQDIFELLNQQIKEISCEAVLQTTK
jgi:hypothetical protein